MTSRTLAAITVVGVVLLGLLGFGAQRFYQSRPAQKKGYSVDLKQLRSQFNADKRKTRLLMLLSPT